MTKEELAEELYNLIVVRGRWAGNGFTDSDYSQRPRWMQEMWEAEAIRFAAEYRFNLED